MGRNPVTIAAVLTAASLFSAAPALAHAMLEKASPRVGETVDVSPSQITLTFSERIEVAMSSIRVSNADGAAIETGPPTRGNGAGVISVAIPAPLTPGKYEVAWSVLSVDGHATKGDFTFVVSK